MPDLRILIIDDAQDDFDLLVRELSRGGYTPDALRIDTAEDFSRALESPWDVILSDYRMPQFNLFDALEIVHRNGLDLPFIVVSGTIGEETAVRAMKAGAHDFIMKDRLARLVPAIERELREAVMRRERRCSEQEVLQARQYLASVFNSLSSLLITVNSRGGITQWNAAAEQYTQVPAREAIGADISTVLPWFAEFGNQLEQVLLQQEGASFKTVQLCGPRKVYFDISIFPLAGSRTSDAVIRMDDVTELELKEQQLRQAQKMEIVGMLAGGLAHDFNNVLCGITGSLSVLRSKMGSAEEISGDQIQLFLDLMQNAGARAINLVKQLLSLSRKKECLVVPFDLNKAVRQAVELCQNTFDKCVEIRVQLNERKATVTADPTQVEQVILNLLVNAYHAMTIMRPAGQQAGGKLSICLGQPAADDPIVIQDPDGQACCYWKLSVTDTGIGIGPDVLEKIFDPFFTTKDAEQGTGLGLAMVAAIIKQHQGIIDVQSEAGAGTTFTLYLPATLQEQPAVALQIPAAVPRGEGLVLIADDELITRQVLKIILESCGYSVIAAEDGIQALELFEKHKNSLQAVLLDLIMPRMSSRDVFLAMQRINSGVKVIIISGLAEDQRIRDLLDLGVMGFIEKPLTINRVGFLLHKVLKAGHSGAGQPDRAD